jgi:hypothetical protein
LLALEFESSPADHDQRREVAGLRGFEGLEEILLGLQLRAARADDVEPARVAVVGKKRGIDLRAVVREQTVRTVAETDERTFRVDLFDRVVEARNHIVTTGRGTAGKNHAHANRSRCRSRRAGFKRDGRQIVGVRKKSADFGIGRAAKRSLAGGGSRGKRGGKFGRVSGAGLGESGLMQHGRWIFFEARMFRNFQTDCKNAGREDGDPQRARMKKLTTNLIAASQMNFRF